MGFHEATYALDPNSMHAASQNAVLNAIYEGIVLVAFTGERRLPCARDKTDCQVVEISFRFCCILFTSLVTPSN